jgi:RimJ/RimL family protein N-acetyltransferase
MEIRPLTGADADAFRALRREALADSPGAFAESVADHDATPPKVWALRFAALSGDNFILGAFNDSGALIGTVGFGRNTGEKTRHKAVIWGVYVKPEARGNGIAKALMREAIRLAKTIEGLEQIKLGVRTGQGAARALYLSLGFEPWGLERRSLKLGDEYVDEDAMALFLR